MGVKITVRDAARLLGVPEKTIYRWIEDRELPVQRAHGQHRFNRTELLEWATAQGLPISAEIFAERSSGDTGLPTLESALAAGGVHFVKGGTDRDAVLRDVVRVLGLPEEVDRDFLFEVMLARENLGSTAVGGGIAIPHVRNPVLLHVRPEIAICFLEEPIPFGAPDGKPVGILFVIVTPTSGAHLRLLSRLAAALHDPGFRRVLAERAPLAVIAAELRRIESAFPAEPNAPAT